MLEESFKVATRMFTAYVQEHTDGIWLSSDVWWSKYGRFNLMSMTAHHVDSNFVYRTFPIAMRNFPGKHTHEQVFNHQCHVYLNLELTHLKDPDTTYFDPNVNVDPEGIISRENMTNYDHDEFTDWKMIQSSSA